MFRKYDSNGDGLLTFDDFKQFYWVAYNDKPQAVWNNILSYNYRNDLKCWKDLDEIMNVDYSITPSYLLSRD